MRINIIMINDTLMPPAPPLYKHPLTGEVMSSLFMGIQVTHQNTGTLYN